MSTGRRILPGLAGCALGLLVGVVACVYLFGRFIDPGPPRYASLEAAIPAAVEEAGKFRWPGTTVRVKVIDGQRVDVERHWLGMTESVVRVEQTSAAWSLGTEKPGPGRAVQEVLVCVVPAAAVGALATRTLRRRPHRPPSGA